MQEGGAMVVNWMDVVESVDKDRIGDLQDRGRKWQLMRYQWRQNASPLIRIFLSFLSCS